MLYQTTTQPLLCFYLLLLGFASGLVFDVSNYIVFLCKNNRVTKIVFDFLATITVCAVLFGFVFLFDYGQMRVYHLLIFFTFLILQRITLGKLIAKFIQVCYNNLTKFFKFVGDKLCKRKNKTNN